MILQALARPGATSFDVGANIGLMAAPILNQQPECHVVSFEASPSVLPYLRRTIEGSPYHNRWKLVPKAVGAKLGRVSFNLSGEADSVYDGIRSTGRVASVSECEVELTTLDETWRQLGSPPLSHIKIDVEGGELDVLRGARECLRSERPVVLLEWNRRNFQAYGYESRSLLDFARELQWQLLTVPGLTPVENLPQLELHMKFIENFLLLPGETRS